MPPTADATARIVILDDQAARGEPLLQKLRSRGNGLDVSLLESPHRLIEAPATPAPDLILFGCHSPGRQHLTTVVLLKSLFAQTPLVVYTDAFREINRLRLLEAGADDMLPVETVLEEIHGYLPAGVTLERGAAAAALETHGRMHFQLNSGDEISNALQFLAMSSREGELMLMFASEEKGIMCLAKGTVVHAAFRTFTGLEAMAHMMSQGQIEAIFFEGKAAATTSLELPLSSILLEASVMADEMTG